MKKSLALLALTAMSGAAMSASFPGTNTGAIPDGAAGPQAWGAPRNVAFAVTGVTAPIESIGLSMTLSHTFVGDLDAVLIAPDATEHVVFRSLLMCGNAGSCPNNGGSNQSITNFVLNFSNLVPGAGSTPATNPWSGALSSGANYTTTTAGGPGQPVGTPTDFRAAFSGVAAPNGSWTLRIRDGWSADTGNVSAATLFINEPVPGLPVELQSFSVD